MKGPRRRIAPTLYYSVTPAELREYLGVLRDSGVATGHVALGVGCYFEVTFVARPVPMGMVDVDGKSIDLDEGMPPLARPDDYDPDAIQRANRPAKQ